MSSLNPQAMALATKAVRALTLDAVAGAASGHVGLPLGCAELGVVLFSEFLRHDPADPSWLDRDRFVLSGGHGSMLLYALLHLSGYAVSLEDLRCFRQLESNTPGHPEWGATPGVEMTTGPLGQGLASAVGMALGERILAARFGSELFDHRTWVLATDGDMMEGVASEASSLAGHLGLGRLIVLYDDNQITIDGPTSRCFSEGVVQRFEAYGWQTQEIDGHDPAQIRAALARASQAETRPHLIRCRTRIGFGSPVAETSAAHGTIGPENTEQTRENLGWTYPPLEPPADAGELFRDGAQRGHAERARWEERRTQVLADPGLRALWGSMIERKLPTDLESLWPDFRGEKPTATRKASGKILNAIAARIPSLIGGSADLAGSNVTALASEAWIAPGKFEGRNLAFGVREHAMAAIANGLSLHGGIRPYIGTFLVFSDYMRPALRLAALMCQPVTYVFTHDSIFVGEDGPTHQPVEQLAALRVIPNLQVWRPADARETRAAWQAALTSEDGPVALALTRQGVAVLEEEGVEAAAARGGYVVLSESGQAGPELILVASGSELHIVLEAGRRIARDKRAVRVVSLPCLERFRAQGEVYAKEILPPGAPRLIVEAGVEQGLAVLLRDQDRFIGMSSFGRSAPYRDLAQVFGFTADSLVARAQELLA